MKPKRPSYGTPPPFIPWKEARNILAGMPVDTPPPPKKPKAIHCEAEVSEENYNPGAPPRRCRLPATGTRDGFKVCKKHLRVRVLRFFEE